MKLTLTDAAIAKINAKVTNDERILLSLDDGVGPFSDAGFCSLETAYDLIVVNKSATTPDYDQPVETNIGQWFVKGYSQTYLDDNMKIDVKNNNFVLSGDSGVLDSAVHLVHA
ncbi:iron-sulfur cluster biosynthesis family protein [Lentilactobacillus sp. Marseille-Q4993]|uniref:iron-sulfur cluster biosynthesis family protein n=1 Tax=Lentilactobacillus sp. Marseille-Q4993 TaxID=3039492 RepID=UPI0024BC9EFB|nr:iron-sulfur cluster biosynthesis family protein [Lentilactobacillus sp. Marseille-Q4993]